MDKDGKGKNGYKVLIMGLKDAGKTSIKRSFFLRKPLQEYDAEETAMLYEKTTLWLQTLPIHVYEVASPQMASGGMPAQFEAEIFRNADGLIFILDSSSSLTMNVSLTYFIQCVTKLQIYSPTAFYFVFFNKADITQHIYGNVFQQLKQRFQMECPNVVHFFRTSIYKPISIQYAFSRSLIILIQNLPPNNLITPIGEIEEYSDKFLTTIEVVTCPHCGTGITKTYKLVGGVQV